MKITNIITYKPITYKYTKHKEKPQFIGKNIELPSVPLNYYNSISFGKKEQSKELRAEVKERIKKLEELGVETLFAANIASLNDENYQKAMNLLKSGVNVEFIEDLAELKPQNYVQALILWKKGIFSSDLLSIANLDKNEFEKAVFLVKKGINSDCVAQFLGLNENEHSKAIELLKDGYPPVVAVHFCKLNKEQQETAQYFLDKETDVEVASAIAQFDEKKKAKCIEYAQMGIDLEFVSELSCLNKKQSEKVPELIALKVGDSNISDFAKMNNKDYKKAMEMLKKGVYSDYIAFIIDEEKKNKNEEYKIYRGRNYSQTTAFSLALLSNQEIDALTRIIKKNPEIRQLFEDEYDVSLVDVQNDDTAEAILTKEVRTDDGTKIRLVKTFDEYSEKTESRTEEYADNSTSSIMRGKTGIFKAKYDKNGEIRELIEYIQAPDTKDVIGVIHSKQSELLSGVFESTFYDISDFKVDLSSSFEAIDTDIENCVINKGQPISTVVQNPDGSITYTESFQKDEMLIDRSYTERKDINGKMIYSSYEYKIKNEDDEAPVMDITREFKRNDDGSVDNVINGNKYHIEYDDKNKVVTISSGEKQRRLFAKNRLPYYSQDVLWNEIKNLQTDTLLDIFDRIKQWNYCIDSESVTNSYTRSFATGTNMSIILHELGHLLAEEEPSILDNENFVQTYGEEMQEFQDGIPYNEQEFVQYFSPRAGLMGANGDDEFVAETNVLLTTYGTTNYKIKTRTQFLEKYFPRTISLVAELLGKNSRKNLLE